MSAYTRTLSVRCNASVLPIAQAIGRSMDPDTGGERSWSREVIGTDAAGEPVYGDVISTSALATEEMYQLAQAMLGDANMLHGFLAQDYATRWPDMVPPTLAECEAFLAAVIPEPVIDAIIDNQVII